MDEQHGRPAEEHAAIGWRVPVTALALAVVVGVGWLVLRPDGSTVSLPVVTPSGTVDSTPTFAGSASITFNLDARPSTPHRTARFEVERANDDVTFHVSFAGKGGANSASGVDGHTNTDRAWWYAPDKYVALALIPGYVRSVTSLGDGNIQLAYLANVDLAAVTVERDPAKPADAFFWTDYNGEVRSSTGETPTSVTILAGASPITVFEDAARGVWGSFDANASFVEPIARTPLGRLRATSTMVGAEPGLARLTWVGLLPAGARNVALKSDSRVVWGAASLGKNGRLVVAGYTENTRDVERRRTGVRSVSYTDASGQRHTVAP